MSDIDSRDLEKMLKINHDSNKNREKVNFKNNQSSFKSSNFDDLDKHANFYLSMLIFSLIAGIIFIVSLFEFACLDRIFFSLRGKLLVNTTLFQIVFLVFEFGLFECIKKIKWFNVFGLKIKNFFKRKKFNNISKLVVLVIILSFVSYNIAPINTFANGIVDGIFSTSISNEKNNDIVNTNIADEAEENIEVFSQNMTFKIEDYNYDDLIDDMKSQFLFYNYTESEIFKEVQYIFENGEKNKYRSFPLYLQLEENNFMNAVCDEDEFITKEIYDNLPYETELLNIITNEYNYAKENMNYFYFERLSNHYQKLALEYNRQYASKTTIMYYYLKSVEFDFTSLSCATNENDYKSSIERIKTRYNDINYCCKTVLTQSEIDQLTYLESVFDKLYEERAF